MGADPTLVNAAYRMGMANVPHDFSASFNKQYEGIIAANQAFADMLSEIPKGIAHIGEKAAERRKEVADWDKKYMMAQIDAAGGSPLKFLEDEFKAGLDVSSKDSLTTDLLKSKVKANGPIYQRDGGLNKAFFDAAHTTPNEIYDKLKAINAKTFLTAKDKADKASLYQDIENWKNKRINDKALIKFACDAVESDLVNYTNMNPELKVLLGQLVDQKADFNDLGIEIFTRDGDYQTMIQYTTNRMETEYEYNKRLEGYDLESKSPIPYEEGRMEVKETVVSSLSEIISNLRIKQVEAERGITGGVSLQVENAAERDAKSNTFKFSWESSKPEFIKTGLFTSSNPFSK